MTISVIVATFGDDFRFPKWARRRAVPSVCAQTIQPLEVIRHHADTLHEARNEAAERAHGDWLCFLDADDELDPRYLEAMTAVARTEQATDLGDDVPPMALLAPAVAMIHGPGDERPPAVLDPGRPMSEVNRCVIGTLVPRFLFGLAGGFRDLPIYEDWDLWLSCLELGAEVATVPEAIYRAHVRPGSRNRQPREVQTRCYDAIRSFHGLS